MRWAECMVNWDFGYILIAGWPQAIDLRVSPALVISVGAEGLSLPTLFQMKPGKGTSPLCPYGFISNLSRLSCYLNEVARGLSELCRCLSELTRYICTVCSC